jgi:hypothetical protein
LTGPYATDLRLYVARKVPGRRRPSAARMRKSPIARGDRGQRVGQLKAGGAVLQTAVMLVVTRHDSSGLLNFTAHSPEDSQRYRKCRSARLQRTVPKGSFQYRTAATRAPAIGDLINVIPLAAAPGFPVTRAGRWRLPRVRVAAAAARTGCRTDLASDTAARRS